MRAGGTSESGGVDAAEEEPGVRWDARRVVARLRMFTRSGRSVEDRL